MSGSQGKVIYLFVPGYLPGFKSGGPVRTISNQVDALGDDFTFRIVCLDRDLGDRESYASIQKNAWNRLGKADVFYVERGARGVFQLISILRKRDAEVINLNGFFPFQFSILPLLITKLLRLRAPVIVGPRGEFSEGALALKYFKKRCYIWLVKSVGFYRSVIWHASTTYEANDILRVMGANSSVRIAIDIAKHEKGLPPSIRPIDAPLRIVFVSRISPMKNLEAAIRLLFDVRSRVSFDVFGPIEDREYWRRCLELSAKLPENVDFAYKGELMPAEVAPTLAKYDLFLFPTLGENFGHVIAEALFAGVPVLISDATPWRDLPEKGVGWDISLDCPDQFVDRIEKCCRKTPEEYNDWRARISVWAIQNIGNQNAVEQNRNLFNAI